MSNVNKNPAKKIFFKFLSKLTQFKSPSLCKTIQRQAVVHPLFFQPVFAQVSSWFRLIILSGLANNQQ